MDENNRDPLEDISLIRQMLERATDSMKAIAPWFTGFGLGWLIYGVFSALQRFAILRMSLHNASRLSFISTVVGTLSCCVLAVGFLICRSRLTRHGLNSLAQKLIDTWGVCIFIFIALTMLMIPAIQILSVYLGYSAETAASLNKACALCRSFLFFLLPVTPLLITAAFLENHRMIYAGIVLAALAAAVLCCHTLMMFGEGTAMGNGWWFFWFGAACLLDLIPGVMLIIFGWQLKGR